MVGLGMALLGGLSSSARAADYVTTCQNGTCKGYATQGSKMPTICYCKPETYSFIQDLAAPSLNSELRATTPTPDPGLMLRGRRPRSTSPPTTPFSHAP